jgi:hypothetical protein
MMLIKISPETCAVETREGFRLALPKFLWAILEGRAEALHQGDLQATVVELVAEELLKWFSEASQKMIQIPAPSNN